jgi:hypothetical protein
MNGKRGTPESHARNYGFQPSQDGDQPRKDGSEVEAKIEDIKANQAKTEFTQEEMNSKMDMHQENMEATVHSIRSELEEAIEHQM